MTLYITDCFSGFLLAILIYDIFQRPRFGFKHFVKASCNKLDVVVEVLKLIQLLLVRPV